MANFSTIEIEQFSNLADRWWDPMGPCKPLHQLNPTRFQYITLHHDLKDAMVLDIGCGGGILSESLAKAGAKVSAIDASEQLIEVAHAHQETLGIHYETTTAEEFAKTHAGEFDVITCMELLEHVPDPQSLLKACQTLLKPGGKLFVSTLNRTPKAYVYAIMAAEYILRLLPKKTHDYNQFIRPSELHQWLTRAGLVLEDLTGLQYNPLTAKAYLHDDLNVNYLGYATKTA